MMINEGRGRVGIESILKTPFSDRFRKKVFDQYKFVQEMSLHKEDDRK